MRFMIKGTFSQIAILFLLLKTIGGVGMKKSLTFKETFLVGLLMFGLFFGAGNLIFPTMIGHESGGSSILSGLGFIITAATIPAIGIAAAALSRNKDMVTLATPVSKAYAIFYSVALYVSIGPAFAIPRNATVSFEIGIKPFIDPAYASMGLTAFSFIFFLGVLVLSLKPAKAMDYIGKYLTPTFLVFLAFLLIAAIIIPVGGFMQFPAQGAYATKPLAQGFFDGYNTMDGLASVIFCLVIIEAVRKLGVTEPKDIAIETTKAGVVCIVAMAIIYGALTYMGAVSINLLPQVDNGGQIFAFMSGYYFGPYGQILLAIIVTLACFKTSIGLVVAGAEFFNRIMPKISVTAYICALTLISFLVANVGLSAIISGAIPVLFFLYPLTISLIVLALMYPWIGKSRYVYIFTTAFTFVAASFDLVKYMPEVISSLPAAKAYVGLASQCLPYYDLGFGWVIPAAIGFAIGYVLQRVKGGEIPR